MKKLARLLIPLALLIVAVPSYAICGFCDFNCICMRQAGSNINCKPTIDCCVEGPANCFTDGSETPTDLSAQYRIASVEVLAVDASQPRVEVARQEKPQQPAPAEIASLKR